MLLSAWISSLFAQHPFVSAGLGFMVVGAVMVYLRRLPTLVFGLVERFCVLKIEIRDEDEAYQWMQVWLADRLKDTLSISVVTKRNPIVRADDDDPDSAQEAQPKVHFVPAVGAYCFWFRGRFVTLYRDRRENPMPGFVAGEGGTRGSGDKETFYLRIFSRDRSLAQALVEECRDMALPRDGKINIRVANYNAWSLSARVRPRPLSSVILDGDQGERLLGDMRRFLAGEAWYEETGVPYRRGYLLHGPPGNGKSSVVKALAGELGMNIYLLMLSDAEMNDNRVSDLLNRVANKSLLLLEDIDCAFAQRKRSDGSSGGLTFSGLLNALDGVAAPEGRIVVMTTNHLDRLDPALIRPGRADVKMAFENATADQARRLYERFFPGEGGAHAFGAQIEDRACSMATLQDYLMLHRDDPQAAIDCVDERLGSRVSAVENGRRPRERAAL